MCSYTPSCNGSRAIINHREAFMTRCNSFSSRQSSRLFWLPSQVKHKITTTPALLQINKKCDVWWLFSVIGVAAMSGVCYLSIEYVSSRFQQQKGIGSMLILWLVWSQRRKTAIRPGYWSTTYCEVCIHSNADKGICLLRANLGQAGCGESLPSARLLISFSFNIRTSYFVDLWPRRQEGERMGIE